MLNNKLPNENKIHFISYLIYMNHLSVDESAIHRKETFHRRSFTKVLLKYLNLYTNISLFNKLFWRNPGLHFLWRVCNAKQTSSQKPQCQNMPTVDMKNINKRSLEKE